MSQATWDAVDEYINRTMVDEDEALRLAIQDSVAAGLPSISVTAAHGKMLALFVRMTGASRVLEIGTLGGYSGIWMARALPAGGRLTTLEINPHHAEVARANFQRAGVDDRIDLLVAPAIESLPQLSGPYDLTFIDADKQSTADYFAHAVRLSRPGAVIVIDNVVREGEVVDAKSENEMVRGVRRFNDALPSYQNVSATTIQTVGAKGYDGFTLAIVS